MASHANELGAILADADSTSATPKLPAFDNTYGALFLGTSVAVMLYGLSVHQTYRYFKIYRNDARWLVWLVIVILILDTFHTIVILGACYTYMVTNFMNPAAVEVIQWSTSCFAPTVGLVVFLCQSFYAHRVWLIGPKQRYLVCGAAMVMVVFLGFTTAATIEGATRSISGFSHTSWLISAMFGASSLTDIMLTGTLVWVLVRQRTGFKRTDSIIEVLILYSINTGLLTSITAVVGFIFGIVLPNNFIYIGISIVSAKLYTNSVLAVLNSRRALSDKMVTQGGLEFGSYELRHVKAPKGSAVKESWGASGPRFSGVRPTSTHISFAVPTSTTESSSETGSKSLDFAGATGNMGRQPVTDLDVIDIVDEKSSNPGLAV